MSWTDERVETLKTMWGDGKSASQIAKELGGVTRNAVIGKVHRLGLSNRTAGETPEPAAPEPEPKPVVEIVPDPEPRPAPAPKPVQHMSPSQRPASIATNIPPQPPKLTPGHPLPPHPSDNEISAEALSNLEEVAKKARRLTLMQLTERTCKWPIGDPATDDFWFCGLPTAAGKPYCETHVAVAFQPMSARRDRRSGSR